MDHGALTALSTQTFLVAAKLGGPILGVALVIGILVSLFQAVTQVQEMTMTFVPKIVAIALVVLLAGSWMLASLVTFAVDLFARLPHYVQ